MKKLLPLFLFLVFFFGAGIPAHAQETLDANGNPIIPSGQVSQDGNIRYVPLEPIPGFTGGSGTLNFGELLNAIFKVLIALGGIIAVGAFVWAGIVYMTSNVVGSKADAIKRIQSSMLGLLILIGSWLILYTINPQLVSFSGALNPAGARYPVTPTPTPTGPVGSTPYPTTPGGIQATDITALDASAAQQTCLTTKGSGGLEGKWATGGGCAAGNGANFTLRTTNGATENFSGCQQVQTVAGYAACYYNQ